MSLTFNQAPFERIVTPDEIDMMASQIEIASMLIAGTYGGPIRWTHFAVIFAPSSTM
jgi:hypothetical protein